MADRHELERQLADLEHARDRAQDEYEEAHQRAGRLRGDAIHAEADVALAEVEGRDTAQPRRLAHGVRAELEQARTVAAPLLDVYLGRSRAVTIKRAELRRLHGALAEAG
jgi:uncharacterized protein YhaN